MAMDITENWETCKENIQPLKGGRRVAKLNQVLNESKSVALNSELKERKHQEFQERIRNYQGTDPLSEWLAYIKWTEEVYPTGGLQSDTLTLLEKCTLYFKDSPQYKNDERYLDVWLKYADKCNDPTDIFTFLEANGIGVAFAKFYIAWASFLELKGNTEKAEKVYDLGIGRSAQPLDKLKRRQRAFHARLMEGVKRSLEEKANDLRNTSTSQHGTDENRIPLGLLRQSTTLRPHAATTTTTTSSSSMLFSQSQTSTRRGRGVDIRRHSDRNFSVFEESESDTPNKLPVPLFSSPQRQEQNELTKVTVGWNYLAPERERLKENRDIPSKWTDITISSQGTAALFTPSIQNKKMETEKFFVYVEEESNANNASLPIVNEKKPKNDEIHFDGTKIGVSNEIAELQNHPLKNISK
jgi:hypothetical protein